MSKPVANYLILNVIVATFLLCFFIAVGQANNNNNNNDSSNKGEHLKDLSKLSPIELKKKEDSLIQIFSKEYNITLDKLSELPTRKQEYIRLRKEEQKAYEDLSKTLNMYFQQIGRNEKIVTKDIKQQLREGELLLFKDSICLESKKKFLSRKVSCKKWEYHFFLKDSKGKTERLW